MGSFLFVGEILGLYLFLSSLAIISLSGISVKFAILFIIDFITIESS